MRNPFTLSVARGPVHLISARSRRPYEFLSTPFSNRRSKLRTVSLRNPFTTGTAPARRQLLIFLPPNLPRFLSGSNEKFVFSRASSGEGIRSEDLSKTIESRVQEIFSSRVRILKCAKRSPAYEASKLRRQAFIANRFVHFFLRLFTFGY